MWLIGTPIAQYYSGYVLQCNWKQGKEQQRQDVTLKTVDFYHNRINEYLTDILTVIHSAGS